MIKKDIDHAFELSENQLWSWVTVCTKKYGQGAKICKQG
jgi:hypothetical protein